MPEHVICRSDADVVAALRRAAAGGERIAVRGGGHCFAGRSSAGDVVLDTSGLDAFAMSDDGVATIGAGLRLAEVYGRLHEHGRTLPAGCGPTVGIAGLTLGGGIGLLGRKHGLTCDRLVGARVVLAGGRVVDCDERREPELFWALRGAGGGQFGVVTALRFDTVPEPAAVRVDAEWSGDAAELVAVWQAWAPDAPDDVTVNLTLDAAPGAPVRARLVGAIVAAAGEPYHRLKDAVAERPGPAQRIRSEFFDRGLSRGTVAALLSRLGEPRTAGRRRLTFTAMGGAYNRVAEDATAFAHRGTRFLLEHIGDAGDAWVDRSWATAHAEGSGRVYPNFPDPALEDSAAAYHAGNHARLAAVKRAYDRDRVFDFHQAI